MRLLIGASWSIASLIVSSASAQTAPYRFDLLSNQSQSNGPEFFPERLLPALNDNGTAAFMLPGPGLNHQIIYTGTPGNVQEVATPALGVVGGVSINNHDRIGFTAFDDVGANVYAITPGGPVVTIARGEVFGNFAYNGSATGETAISDSGSVMAFTDEPRATPGLVVVGDGVTPAQAVLRTRDPWPTPGYRFTSVLRHPRMSRTGEWVIYEQGGSLGLWGAIHDRHGSAYGGANSLFTSQWLDLGPADIAADDKLVFAGKLPDGARHLFASTNGSAPAPIPGTEGLLAGVLALNDAGQIALLDKTTEYGTRLQLFRDGGLETVLAQGDALFGSTVSTIGFDAKGFNNSDQFALLVSLADGRNLYVLASPVPEPAAGCAGVTLTLFALWRRPRRRGTQ
jgi:hypothetical protein